MYANRIRIRLFYQYLCDLQLSKMNSVWRTVNYTDKEVFAKLAEGVNSDVHESSPDSLILSFAAWHVSDGKRISLSNTFQAAK